MTTPEITAALLLPRTVTDAMIAAGTSIPEIDAGQGEIAWSSATSYAVADQAVAAGWIYAAVAANSNKPPAANPNQWRRVRPTNRRAPFDDQINTAAVAAGALTYVLRPGFFDGLELYGVAGEHISITLYDAPGGTVVEHYAAALFEQATGLYEYLFKPLRAVSKVRLSGLPLLPNPELHITVSAAAGADVRIGMLVVGFWESLLGTAGRGGVEFGATAEVKPYSYISTDTDGVVTIVPRHTATNIRTSVVIDADAANNAHGVLERVASMPVAFVASGLPRYAYLNTFGLVSGVVTPLDAKRAKLDLTIKGFI